MNPEKTKPKTPRTSKYVHSLDEVPIGPHWVIIKGTNIYHEEHGVWAPGHGYPAYTEKTIRYYQVFDNEQEFIAEMEYQLGSQYITDSVLGLHIDKVYTKETKVKVVTNDGSGNTPSGDNRG